MSAEKIKNVNNYAFIFIKTIPRYLVGTLLCLTTLAVFIPINPGMPAAGLDSSWVFAMNQAVAQRLVFGKDIVFTFGPYASIYTMEYHPATYNLMVWASLFLGVCYSLLLLRVARGIKFYWLLTYGLFLAGLMFSRDALLVSYPLLLALVTYRITLPSSHACKIDLSKSTTIGVAILFAPLGLLSLIKGSLILISVAIAVLCFSISWYSEKKFLAYATAIVPLVSSVIFWGLSGQPIFALPAFFANMGPIISGYTEAMGSVGSKSEIAVYLFVSVLILYTATINKLGPISSRLFLFLSYALFLFIAFKGGFVRHDGHACMAGTSLIIAALSMTLISKEISLAIVLLLSTVSGSYINKGYLNTSTGTIYNNIRNTYLSPMDGLRMRLAKINKLKETFDSRVSAIKNEYIIPTLQGTTDIYSYHQSYLLASGNIWAPRPIIQSYSAYTPSLAKLNAQHLLGENSPDNILFRVEPIDGRLPALEDGLSWPALINNYSVTKIDNDLAYLKKNESTNNDNVPVEFYNVGHKLGEEVLLPETKDPLFAEIDITPTILGKLLSVVFKPPQLNIALKLHDGRTKNFRIISNMARAGFLISPLIENTKEFVFLTAGNNKYLASNAVKSITISPKYGKFIFWDMSYSMRLKKLKLIGNTDFSKIYPFDKIDTEDASKPRGILKNSITLCDAVIDTINGVLLPQASLSVSGTLSVEGWHAISAKDGIVPDAVFVTLTSESGETLYIKARRTPRRDVKEYFKQPKMSDVGFTAYIDVSGLSGKYTLGLSRLFKGNMESCQQFSLPLLISPYKE